MISSTSHCVLAQVTNIHSSCPTRAFTEHIPLRPCTGRNPTRDRLHSHLFPLDYVSTMPSWHVTVCENDCCIRLRNTVRRHRKKMENKNGFSFEDGTRPGRLSPDSKTIVGSRGLPCIHQRERGQLNDVHTRSSPPSGKPCFFFSCFFQKK